MVDIHGTGIEIWAEFGPVGITEKKIGSTTYEPLEAGFFMFSWAKK